jgi:hypothetical protein
MELHTLLLTARGHHCLWDHAGQQPPRVIRAVGDARGCGAGPSARCIAELNLRANLAGSTEVRISASRSNTVSAKTIKNYVGEVCAPSSQPPRARKYYESGPSRSTSGKRFAAVV